MKIRLLVVAGALFVAGGTSRADVAGVVVFCAPGLDSSGKQVTKCVPAPGGDGQDPGTGGWQQPEPGWLGTDGIGVTGATYGGNCGARDNASYDLEVACDGAMTCSYTIDYRVLGDPAPGCAKDFRAVYVCPGSTMRHQVYVAPEAGFDKVLTMSCQ